jgi:molecular chaperone GrpE
MDREQTAGPVGDPPSDTQVRGGASTTGPVREQIVNDTTPNSSPDAAPGKGESTSTEQAEAADADAVLAGEVVAGDAPTDDAPGSVASELSVEPDAEPVGAKLAGARSGPPVAELAALRSELDERTADLQRLSAEYANYRKRVERDRLVVAEQATAQVVAALLPVLDDLDRAREHGDLVGPFASMAEQLGAALAKFGLTGFGEVGDAFDPTRHEAVTHQMSGEVTAPTCVAVMRRGYLLGERLLRPALVAVADPESQ